MGQPGLKVQTTIISRNMQIALLECLTSNLSILFRHFFAPSSKFHKPHYEKWLENYECRGPVNILTKISDTPLLCKVTV